MSRQYINVDERRRERYSAGPAMVGESVHGDLHPAALLMNAIRVGSLLIVTKGGADYGRATL
jgi:hypothetical protein